MSQTYSWNMHAITLKAHFDGQQIVLDEPFELPLNSPLIVTVLAAVDGGERTAWSQMAAGGLARAYSEEEPEYSSTDLRP